LIEQVVRLMRVANADSVDTLEDGASIVEQALKEWDRVDIVINNAGITLSGPFLENSEKILI
jgi:NADP-dependent 3-hydroxy acid dehydrogenase YdfG